MDIAGLVRAARAETGLSQKALARRAGVAPSVLSRVESGTRLPSLPVLDQLLAACGRDAQWRLLWLPDDAATTTAAIGLMRRYFVNLVEDGRPVGAAYDPEMLQCNADRTWVLQGLQFRLTVLDNAQEWPVEVRVPGSSGPLRVLAPAELGEGDGVRPEVLDRWLQWRSGRRDGQGHQREQHDGDGDPGG